MTDLSTYSRFQTAVAWARNETFWRSGGVLLSSRWVTLSSELAASVDDKLGAYATFLELARCMDIDVARPYLAAGVFDADIVKKAVMNGVSPEEVGNQY